MGGGRRRVVGEGWPGVAGHCVTVWELGSVRACDDGSFFLVVLTVVQ